MITELARAKVNLALHVTGRLPDGYHTLDSLVAFADVGDRLSFAPAARTELTITGRFAAGLSNGEDNLVMRAARILGEAVPPARIELEKLLPVASGIGGGSADAAATLRGLIRLGGAKPDLELLTQKALQLGADVPVCLRSSACRMQGIGEIVTPHEFPHPLPAVLVNPGAAVGTAEVFRKLGLTPGAAGFAGIAGGAALDRCRNDLEPVAMTIAPAIRVALAALHATKPQIARMSGSGATCFGLYATASHARMAAHSLRGQYRDWWVTEALLS